MRKDEIMFALGALHTCTIGLAVMTAPDWVSRAFRASVAAAVAVGPRG